MKQKTFLREQDYYVDAKSFSSQKNIVSEKDYKFVSQKEWSVFHCQPSVLK